MVPDDRNRFLISFAKFLGINPTEEHPLAGVIIAETWLVDEILSEIIPVDGAFALNVETLSRLMLSCGRGLLTKHFYSYFFSGVDTLEEFESAVEKYRIKAMWLFGNFDFAYKKIATSDLPAFESLMRDTEPIDPDIYQLRSDFEDIEEVPVDDLEFLGYISSGELDHLDFARKLIDTLIELPQARESVLNQLGAAKQVKLSDLLLKFGIGVPRNGIEGLGDEALHRASKQLSQAYNPLKTRQKSAIAIGIRNTHRYLTLPYLDAYVATSMRTHKDYLQQHQFIKDVFSDPAISPLKLRYFDPTLSYVEDRISKGLVEMLMLQRATATIYNAGTEDTLGKDSELAATLAQGKAVIVYVPSDSDLDRRADMFRVGHPLGLQINIRTGVAHGIIVVRTAKQCAEMLRKVMMRQRTFTIRHQGGNFLLEETDTRSVLRVVSDDPFLTHAFWTYFHNSGAGERD